MHVPYGGDMAFPVAAETLADIVQELTATAAENSGSSDYPTAKQ